MPCTAQLTFGWSRKKKQGYVRANAWRVLSKRNNTCRSFISWPSPRPVRHWPPQAWPRLCRWLALHCFTSVVYLSVVYGDKMSDQVSNLLTPCPPAGLQLWGLDCWGGSGRADHSHNTYHQPDQNITTKLIRLELMGEATWTTMKRKIWRIWHGTGVRRQSNCSKNVKGR